MIQKKKEMVLYNVFNSDNNPISRGMLPTNKFFSKYLFSYFNMFTRKLLLKPRTNLLNELGCQFLLE